MTTAPADAACLHCRLPLPGSARGSFCCAGCRAVYSLLGSGLGSTEGSGSQALLGRVILCAFLSMGVMVFSLSLYGLEDQPTEEAALAMRGLFRLGALLLSAPVLVLLGFPLAHGVRTVRGWLSADGLILCGVAAAWLLSTWSTFTDGPAVYFETATMVLVLVSLGKWLDVRARERARSHLGDLAEASDAPAAVIQDDGTEVLTPSAEWRVGMRVRVRAGAKIPVDGVVEEGRSFVDTSTLTGEEAPVSVGVGDPVLAGGHLVDGTLLLRATAICGSRVQDEIARLLERSMSRRPGLARLADRVAGLFLPLVLILATSAAGVTWSQEGAEAALLHALTILLIACPCALGLATPLAFWVALGEAWRRGILVRDAAVFERLARAKRIYLDKTGTLTSGQMELVEVLPLGKHSTRELLAIAAALEDGSEHPIGRCLRQAAGDDERPTVHDFRALPGVGIEGRIGSDLYRLRRQTDESAGSTAKWTTSELARNDMPVAQFRLASRSRPEAARVISQLKLRRLEPVVLTGDGAGPAAALSAELGVPVVPELLPQDKARYLEERGTRGSVFVGEGWNDAPVLATADVGVAAFGATDTSNDAASVVFLKDDLRALPELFELAEDAVWRARASLAWAFSYNLIGLWLAVRGHLTPVLAAAAMALSSAFVVLQSTRGGASVVSRGTRASAPGPRPSAVELSGCP